MDTDNPKTQPTFDKRRLILPLLANELLDEVVQDLDVLDCLSVMRTCRLLHDIVARVLYRVVIVSEMEARKFFRTVVQSERRYGQYVRTLSYMASSNDDVALTYFLLCDAILEMECLLHLNLTVRAELSPFLLHLFKSRSIIRPAMFSIGDSSTKILPNLEKFSLHGDLSLMDLVNHRKVTSLSINIPLSETGFKYFLNMTTDDTKTNYTLRDLVLVLRHSIGSRIIPYLRRLGCSFPNLRSLVVRTPTANALDVTTNFAVMPPIFPRLRTFKLNNWTVLDPVFLIPENQALEQQWKDIRAAGEIMQDLDTLSFGTIHWSRLTYSTPWAMKKASVSDMDGEIHSDDFLELPIFWDVMYHNPSLLPWVDADAEPL